MDAESLESAKSFLPIGNPLSNIFDFIIGIFLSIPFTSPSVPAVAFTRRGERLGRGKGFYDCYLSREGFRAYTVGVCYSHQLLDTLPTEPHDRRVDEVVVGE